MPSPVYSNSGANLFLSKLKGKFKHGHDHRVSATNKRENYNKFEMDNRFS